MTKKIKLSFLFIVFICLLIITSCSKEKIETAVDAVKPVIKLEEEIQIDFSTEKFNLYDDVVVTDVNANGEEEVLTSNIEVNLPLGVTKEENNNIKFKKPGDYIFTYTATDNSGNTTSKERLVKVRNIYNCYWVNATLPVLYCALDMVSNDYKSILVFTRKDTLDIDTLDNERFIYKVNGADVAELETAKKYTSRIAALDEWSYFRLFLCDAFNQIELFSFVQNGIPESRYEVKLVSDGSWTYNTAFPYREDNSYDLWNKNLEIYNNIRKEAFLGNFKYEKDISGFPMFSLKHNDIVVGSHYYADAQLSEMAIMAAQRENVELWCGYPETLVSKDARVQNEIKKAHMPKMSPDKMYSNFSETEKSEFLKIVNFNKKDFDEKYFNMEGEYLIITGTNPVSGNLTEDEFIGVLNNIIKDYKNHHILFKPHPSAIPSETNYSKVFEFFKENNIKVLPGRLPMEVISWVYPNVKLGGFDSSLFMAVPQGNTQFFIAQDVQNLSILTKHLYLGGAFGKAKFYWK